MLTGLECLFPGEIGTLSSRYEFFFGIFLCFQHHSFQFKLGWNGQKEWSCLFSLLWSIGAPLRKETGTWWLLVKALRTLLMEGGRLTFGWRFISDTADYGWTQDGLSFLTLAGCCGRRQILLIVVVVFTRFGAKGNIKFGLWLLKVTMRESQIHERIFNLNHKFTLQSIMLVIVCRWDSAFLFIH